MSHHSISLRPGDTLSVACEGAPASAAHAAAHQPTLSTADRLLQAAARHHAAPPLAPHQVADSHLQAAHTIRAITAPPGPIAAPSPAAVAEAQQVAAGAAAALASASHVIAAAAQPVQVAAPIAAGAVPPPASPPAS